MFALARIISLDIFVSAASTVLHKTCFARLDMSISVHKSNSRRKGWIFFYFLFVCNNQRNATCDVTGILSILVLCACEETWTKHETRLAKKTNNRVQREPWAFFCQFIGIVDSWPWAAFENVFSLLLLLSRCPLNNLYHLVSSREATWTPSRNCVAFSRRQSSSSSSNARETENEKTNKHFYRFRSCIALGRVTLSVVARACASVCTRQASGRDAFFMSVPLLHLIFYSIVILFKVARPSRTDRLQRNGRQKHRKKDR